MISTLQRPRYLLCMPSEVEATLEANRLPALRGTSSIRRYGCRYQQLIPNDVFVIQMVIKRSSFVSRCARSTCLYGCKGQGLFRILTLYKARRRESSCAWLICALVADETNLGFCSRSMPPGGRYHRLLELKDTQ